MKNTTKKSNGWSAVRQQLNAWDKPALIALLKDLYEIGPENRDFIHARNLTEKCGGEALEMYRNKIVEQFYPPHGDGKLKLGEARKAIHDYHKVTGNIPGTVELLMTYVENAIKFVCEYGDMEERFYDSMESALSEFAKLVEVKAHGLYPQFRDRLARVEEMSEDIGWGFHDYVGGIIEQMETKIGNQ
jgi:hypothetical protein